MSFHTNWVDVVEKGRDPIAVPLDAAWVD